MLKREVTLTVLVCVASHLLKLVHVFSCCLFRIWDLSTGQVRASIKSGTRVNFCVAITPAGTSCVTGADDDHIRWEMQIVCMLYVLVLCCVVLGVAEHSSMSAVASAARSRSHQHTNTHLHTLTSHCMLCTYRMWDLVSGQLAAVMDGHTNDVICLAVSPDGTICVSGSDDGTVRVWDIAGQDANGILPAEVPEL